MANTTDWLNISQESGGTGQTSLTLTALTNSSLSAKTATITAKNDTYNVSGTSTVTIQGFVPTLTLSRSTLRFDSTGGTATFTVYSNTAWTITFPALVHSYSTSAGTGDTEVTVVLSPNPDEVAKIDTGIVEDCYGVNSLYLTIVQEAFIAELTVEPDDDIEFVNTGSSTSVTITTNTDWDISCPSWVTASSYSGESGTTVVTFTAAQNGPTDRTSTIDIYAGSKSVSINVFQPLYIPPYITVTPSAWTFNYTEDGKTFVVDSYPAWSGEIISTGETVWTSDRYMEATFSIPSAVTMPLYSGGSGDTSAIYVGPVKQYGSEIYFPEAGTYKIRYEIGQGGRTPSLQGNTYLTDLYFSDGIDSLPNSAYSGCSSLTGIISDCAVAPAVYNDTFKNVGENGTLIYPGGSDYSSWLATEKYYLGYYFWNNIQPNYIFAFSVTYDIQRTGATQILPRYYTAGGSVNFVRDEQGTIKRLEEGDYMYNFTATGKQRLDFSISRNGTIVYLNGVSAATDLQINNEGYFSLYFNNEDNIYITGLTLYKNLVMYGNAIIRNIRYLKITGVTDTFSKRVIPIGSIEKVEIFGEITALGTGEYDNFFGAVSLTSVTMSDKITYLGNNAFNGCSALQEIVLPSGVTTVGNYCFDNCSSLRDITCLATVAPSLGNNYTFGQVGTNGVLRYPIGSDYSSWLSDSSYYLGYYGWTGVEI